MWLKLVLCFIATLVYADQNPGWKPNHEYTYDLRGRTLASLNQISSNFTGILFKAKLAIRPTSDGNLGAKISNFQYANIHCNLDDGWQQEIPDSELQYENLPLSSEPFKIVMDDGVVRQIAVKKSVKNWEANVIKGIVSQLQIDTQGKNIIDSYINLVPKDLNEAVFKTMEKTVQGEVETLYDIHPLPNYLLQTTPWLVPISQERHSQLTEIVKNKNFTHSKESPAYNFGFDGVDSFEIDSNIAQSLSRSSMTRAVISGTLNRFTLQSCVTIDQIMLNPSRDDKQRGSTNTIVNITLSSIEPKNDDFQNVSDAIYTDLVYSYDTPFDENNGPAVKKSFRQEKPHMHEAPASPLLPLTVGFNGEAISTVQNIRENSIRLAKQIGEEVQQPEEMPRRNTAGKFLLLSSLVRVMNYKEVQEVSSKLYSTEREGAAASAWIAYRDAVAQAGTGPTLLLINDWIAAKQISDEEAARLVASAADSARTPTEKYTKYFFQMIQNNEIMAQSPLNESLILSYTTLLHQVYVNDDDSRSKYPVYSFGSFKTAEGKRFVAKEVIPYFTQKLSQAIDNTDTRQIHAYIRALGNIGHPQILTAFKPYLEGTKKASQFQRVLMVVALDQLARNDAQVARSVLYKICQNRNDFEQVRVAAIYQLMKTNPSADLLQRLAALTNIDNNNNVNAAIKSVIESAANLKQSKYTDLRAAAESAKPLLTNQEFGIQHSAGHLTSYVVEQMQVEYEQQIETHGGEDSSYPKGISYYLQGIFGGIRQRVINVQSMVSSVDDLLNVFEQQTSEYRRLLAEKQSQKSEDVKFSSENTAKWLKLQNEQREQLEGSLYLQMQSLQKIWSFDNQTFDNLEEVVMDWERKLKNGHSKQYSKMEIHPESAIAFPTAWGLPFVYSHDSLTLTQFKSDIKFSANPSIGSNDGLQKPETIEAELQISGFLYGKSQNQFGFFAPFNNKRYSAGYDKNFQVVVPETSAKINADVDNSQITLHLQNINRKKNNKLLHFSSWPYTAQYDIYTPELKTQVISSANPQQINMIVGKKSTGIAFSVQATSDQTLDYGFFYDKLSEEDLPSAFLRPWLKDQIQHVEINIGIDSARSSTNKLTIHLGRQQKFSAAHNRRNHLTVKNDIVQESVERQEQFLNMVEQNLTKAQAHVIDFVTVFEGEKLMSYAATFASARSDADLKGQGLAQFLKNSKEEKPLKIIFKSNVNVPVSSELNANEALRSDSSVTVHVEGSVENSEASPKELRATFELRQSEARKEYLKQQLFYKNCQREMEERNNQMPGCASLTVQANLLDQFSFKLQGPKIDETWSNRTYKLYSMFRQIMYPRLTENILGNAGEQQEESQIEIKGGFSPDLSRVSASLRCPHGSAAIQNIEVSEWSRNIFVLHPQHHVRTRLQAYATKYDTYKPICVVDKQAVNSLDNKTYPANVGNDWVVMLQYVPRRASSIPGQPILNVAQQLNQEIESSIAYVRASEDNPSQKEVKLVVQSSRTSAVVTDITMKPSESSSGYPRLFVQNEEIKYDNKASHEYNNYMQVQKLPNKELKVEVYDWFIVVFDGERVKITLLNNKFRDASRGLCGTFTGEQETDFTNPANCILENPSDLVRSYSIPSAKRGKLISAMAQEDQDKCYKKTIEYVRIVSYQDTNSEEASGNRPNIHLQTRYLRQGDKTCFSTEPLPTCKQGHKQNATQRVNVSVHCLKTSSVTDMLTKQIDQGANPSFKSKAVSMRTMMPVAQSCSE